MALRKAPAPVEPEPIVLGARLHPLRDMYHGLMRAPWSLALGLLSLIYLLINLLFATAYWIIGGVTNAAPASFGDAFFFSVQTLSTIGYGGMLPGSPLANALVTLESIVGVFVTAIFTGLVFSKFATSTARMIFSNAVVIGPHDGVRTLMLRIGNDRNDSVLDAKLRLAMIRTVRTKEGKVFYPMIDLTLCRTIAPYLRRSFTLMHPIDEQSPLYGLSAADLADQEIELLVSVSGLDETTKIPVHALHTYAHDRILFDHHLVDVLSETPEGRLVLDVSRFHDVEPIEPIEPGPSAPRPSPT